MGNRTDFIASFEVDSLFPTDITFTLSICNLNLRQKFYDDIMELVKFLFIAFMMCKHNEG